MFEIREELRFFLKRSWNSCFMVAVIERRSVVSLFLFDKCFTTHLTVFRTNLPLTKAQHTWLETEQLFKLSRALLYLSTLVPRPLWYTVATLRTAHWSPNAAPRALYSMIKVLFLATKAYHSENEIPQPATQVYGSTVEILQSATQATHHWATGASKSTRYSTNRKLFSPSWQQCLWFIVFL